MTAGEICKRSSIETEPRTLSFEQLRGAREEALSVMKTKPMDEAISIFTQGLKPVPSIRSLERMHWDSSEDSEESINHDNRHGLDLHARLREILTAPF